ncbi:MAG: hypothetical protein WBQ78_17665 [Gammaproteobacteria bacterium]
MPANRYAQNLPGTNKRFSIRLQQASGNNNDLDRIARERCAVGCAQLEHAMARQGKVRIQP